MEKAELKIEYEVYKESCPEEYKELCHAAFEMTRNAYCKYSEFAVGAAVLLNNGEIVCGSNQENAAFPSGICAERTALFYACSTFPEVGVKAMAVAARNKGVPLEVFITPCGACRQVISEVIKRYRSDFDVILIGRKTTISVKASQLLPFAFDM